MEELNIKRIGKLMRYSLCADTWRSFFIGTYSVFSIIALFFMTMLPWMTNVNTASERLGIGIKATYGMMVGFLVIVPCLFWFDVKKKSSMINLLVLPATHLEKFISRYLLLIIGGLLLCVASFITADVLQWIYYSLFNPAYGGLAMARINFYSLHFFRFNFTVNGQNLDNYLAYAIGCMGPIWFHSVYLLFGMLFKKMSWIVSSAIIIVFFILFGKSVEVGLFGSVEILAIVVLSLLVIFVIFNYVMSYKIFRHIQVIHNKWMRL